MEETVQTTAEVDETIETQSDTEGGQQTIALNDLRIGYVVGLTKEGTFVFDLFGTQKGLVELLGIHQHAGHRVDSIYNDQQSSGDRLVHEVGKAVQAVSQKLDQLLQGTTDTPTTTVSKTKKKTTTKRKSRSRK